MRKDYKVNYSGIIDTLELNATRKALLKSAWLDYLLLLEKLAGRGWLMNTACQLAIFVFGILIPLIDSTLLNANLGHSGLKIVGLLGMLIAVFTFLTRLLGFDRKWIHYRKHTELVRNEGDDYLGLSGIYKDFSSHDEGFETFFTVLTTLKRKENATYMDDQQRNIQQMQDDHGKKNE